MLSTFLRNTSYTSIFIFLIAISMWFIIPIEKEINYTLLSYDTPKYLTLLTSFILTSIVGLILNNQLKINFLIKKNSNAFFLFHTTLSSLSTNYDELLLLTFFNLCFSLAISLLLKINDEKIGKNIFNTTLIVGFLCLLSYLFIPFLYLIVIGIKSVRRIKTIDVLTMIIAFLLPLLILFSFSFISDNYKFIEHFQNFNFRATEFSLNFTLLSLSILVLGVSGIISHKNDRNISGAKVIRVSNTILFLYILSFLIGFLNLFIEEPSVLFMCISFPSAAYLTVFFLKPGKALKSIIFITFMLACIIYNYYQ